MQVRSIIELWNPNTGVWEASTVGGPNVNVGNDINVSNFPAAINDPTIKYKISDIDTVVQENQYFGYVASDGTWYIMNLTTTGARYVKGASGYTVNWGNRAILSYDYFNVVFLGG